MSEKAGTLLKKYFPLLGWYFAASLAGLAMAVIFAGAGFSWRNPCMEYTQKGKLMTNLLLCVPVLLVLCTLGIRCLRLYRKKMPVRQFFLEVLLCTGGGCCAFLFCLALFVFDLFPKWIYALESLIENSDWMRWPPP